VQCTCGGWRTLCWRGQALSATCALLRRCVYLTRRHYVSLTKRKPSGGVSGAVRVWSAIRGPWCRCHDLRFARQRLRASVGCGHAVVLTQYGVGNRSRVVVLIGIAGLAGCGSDGVSSDHGSSGNASIGGDSSVGGTGASGGAIGGRSGGTTSGTSAGGAATAGADDLAEAGSGGQRPESACGDYATARCTRLQACSPKRFQITYSSLADCERATVEACNGELDAPGSKATAEAISTCAKDSAAQNCGDFLSVPPVSCIVAGSLAAGAGCVFNSQCEST